MPDSFLAILVCLFVPLWLGCALAMVKSSSLNSWLRYLDAAMLMPGLLVLLMLNLAMSWHISPWLVEFTGAVSDAAGTVAAPLAFLVCAPFPVAGFILWRKTLRRLDRKLSAP